MSLLDRILGRKQETPDNPDQLIKPYGEVVYPHLKPGSYDVNELGVFDPDVLKIAVTKFIDHHPGVVESVRVATYPCKQTGSHYLMIQDEFTNDPGRWYCIAPLKNSG